MGSSWNRRIDWRRTRDSIVSRRASKQPQVMIAGFRHT